MQVRLVNHSKLLQHLRRDLLEDSQETLANRAGLSRAIVDKLETGRRELTPDVAQKFRDYAGLDPEALMRGELKDLSGKPFTKVSVAMWRSVPIAHEALRATSHLLNDAIEVLLGIAANHPDDINPTPQLYRPVVSEFGETIRKLVVSLGLDRLKASTKTERKTEVLAWSGTLQDVATGALRREIYRREGLFPPAELLKCWEDIRSKIGSHSPNDELTVTAYRYARFELPDRAKTTALIGFGWRYEMMATCANCEFHSTTTVITELFAE